MVDQDEEENQEEQEKDTMAGPDTAAPQGLGLATTVKHGLEHPTFTPAWLSVAVIRGWPGLPQRCEPRRS